MIKNPVKYCIDILDPVVIGKGPTFSRGFEVGGDKIFLNQAAFFAKEPGFISVFNDFEPFLDLGEHLFQARYVWMNWQPHWRGTNAYGNLIEFMKHCDLLRRLNDAGKLCSFNLACHAPFGYNEHLPTVHCFNSTSQSAFDILAQLGHKKITSAGIDGGVGYHSHLSHTLSKDNNVNYDCQFVHLNEIVQKWAIEWRRL